MNLQPYRKSFTVFIAGSKLEQSREVLQLLADVGYTCEYKLKSSSLLEDIFKNPPHIVVLFYGDGGFFKDEYEYESLIAKLLQHLPELQIIFLANQESYTEACDLYEFGIYDCVQWPTNSPVQFLKAVDRAAANDYYMYLNEQLKEKLLGHTEAPATDFAFFDMFVKEIEGTSNKSDMIEYWMREAMRVHDLREAMYMTYIENKKSLLVTHANGFAPDDVRDVGLDLQKEEPGFYEDMLRVPEKLRSLHQFVLRGLQRREALYYSLIVNNKVQGVFILPSKEGEMFTVHQVESPYLKMCIHLISRRMEYCDLNEKYRATTIYDELTGLISGRHFQKKLLEEVSRARRIMRPVSIIQLSIDGYDDITLSQSRSVAEAIIKSAAEILIKNSRLNDMIGRIDKNNFILCLPHTDKRGAVVKAERLRRIFSNADFSSLLGKKEKLSVSVGVSEYPGICNDSESLVKSSEKAMYDVRRKGGNKILVAEPTSHFVPDFVVENAKDI